jgi:hypothetical protein
MLRQICFAIAFCAISASALAQEKNATVADFTGTWNIEVMSHQVALVIEPQEGNQVTATMMMMGRDVPLKGELSGRTISFVGVKELQEHVDAVHGGGASQAGSQNSTANARPIVVTLLEDGTLSGEMMTTGGPVKWVGEKLKAKKKS